MEIRQQVPLIKVVGTFRSGTNLMKFLIEDSFAAQVLFNNVWWKHSLAPALVASDQHYRPSFPIVVMVRKPVSQNVSLYRFWQRKRPSLLGGKSFAEFIRSGFVVHDTSFLGLGPKYLFPTPTDYWNAFYFSYLGWDAAKDALTYVDLDQLKANTSEVLKCLRDRLRLAQKKAEPGLLPQRTILPGDDHSPARFGDPRLIDRDLVSVEDEAFIGSRVNQSVYELMFGIAGAARVR